MTLSLEVPYYFLFGLLLYVDLNHFKIMYSRSVYAFYETDHSIFFRQCNLQNNFINMTYDAKKVQVENWFN
ncbi:hypothetical protein ACSO1_23830 [Acinetobacter calcoaceticus]|nr:hypothetical protein ACSO1_23830 [Acinetobacter calcoaceticus]